MKGNKEEKVVEEDKVHNLEEKKWKMSMIRSQT
jgi:hypothetical protein